MSQGADNLQFVKKPFLPMPHLYPDRSAAFFQAEQQVSIC